MSESEPTPRIRRWSAPHPSGPWTEHARFAEQEGEWVPIVLADWLAHTWGRRTLAVRVRVSPRL